MPLIIRDLVSHERRLDSVRDTDGITPRRTGLISSTNQTLSIGIFELITLSLNQAATAQSGTLKWLFTCLTSVTISPRRADVGWGTFRHIWLPNYCVTVHFVRHIISATLSTSGHLESLSTNFKQEKCVKLQFETCSMLTSSRLAQSIPLYWIYGKGWFRPTHQRCFFP